MSKVFDKQITEALDNAQKLKLAGEEELSTLMCQKIVKKVAVYNSVDLITLFYGEEAYSDVQDVADALKYVFIIKCAMQAYDAVYSKNSANYGAASWAKRDKTNSNRDLRRFFEWLQRRDKKVDERDCNQFKVLINLMSNSDNVYFKMSDRVAQMTLVDIISMIVSGSVSVSSDGELR
ncbi:MAG: hypothetical protein ACI4MQ_07870 [Candidatus Coproplasma sp.]